MPIRDADNFFFPKEKVSGIFSNRGVSGIDGNIATAIGIARGIKKPLICCLGDLAFLHDLGSLAQIKSSSYPVLFIVLNNAGGGIFSFLSIANEKQYFDKFFKAKHNLEFSSIAQQFALPYLQTDDLEEFKDLFKKRITLNESAILEVRTDSTKNVLFHEGLKNAIKLANSVVITS